MSDTSSIERTRAMEQHSIRADEETTWPSEALALLDAGFETIKGWVEFRLDLERKYDAGDFAARYNPPPNPYDRARRRILSQL